MAYVRGLGEHPGVDAAAWRKWFAARVKTLRKKKRLRQDQLEFYGVSWKTIQNLEYGKTDPRVSTLLKLCQAFGMKLSELVDDGAPHRRWGTTKKSGEE